MAIVRYWAAARHAAGLEEERIEALTFDELKSALEARTDVGKICAYSSYLIDGAQVREGESVGPDSVVDVLPPFAGG